MASNRTYLLAFLLLFVAVGSANPNITYAPPPPINSTLLFTLNSSVDTRYISSKRIEALGLSPTVLANSSVATVFSLDFFNRTAPNNMNRYNFTQVGNWSFVTGTKETASCSLVYESSNQYFGLVQFIAEIGSFKMMMLVPVATLPVQIQALLQTQPLNVIAGMIFLGENCRHGYFASPTGSTLYQVSPDLTTLMIVPVPSNFSFQTTVQSFQYATVNNVLYKLDPVRTQYNQTYSFPPSSDYKIKVVANRIVVTTSNSTTFTDSYNRTKYSINQTIYFFVDDQTNGLTLLGTHNVSGTEYAPRFEIYASPQLTKVGFGYTPLNSNDTVIVSKSIDYANKQVFDVVSQDSARFLTTMKGISSRFFDFSDYYFIARNDSNLLQNSTGQVVEEAYQFVGNQIVFFRSRNIPAGNEINNFARIFVDPFFPNQLVVLDVNSRKDNATNATIGYQVIQHNYGTLASMSVIIPQATPPFLSFIVPAGTNAIASTILEWAYYSINATALTTSLYYFRANRNVNNNLIIQNYTLPGLWSLLANNPSCSLGKDTTNNYVLYQTVDNNLGPLAYLTEAVSAIGVNATSVWRISQNCDRYNIGKQIFSFSQATPGLFQPITNNITAFDWTSIDDNLTTAIVGSQVWRYNAAQNNSFVLLFDTLATILPTQTIRVLKNALIITATSNSSAQVLAFTVSSSGTATNCLNYSVTGFSNVPKIQVSQNLTKVLIMGPLQTNGTISPKADMFFIDYANAQSQSITFPLSTLIDPMYTHISLNEKFLYIRQLQNPDVSHNASRPNQEFFYYLSQDLYPQVAKTSNIDPTQATTWIRTLIQTTPDGNTYVMDQNLQGNASATQSVVITQRQITATQASLNSNSNQGVTGYMSNGKIKLCSPGCRDCSTGTCTACITGFVFESIALICYTCGLNCVACLSSNPNSCSSCMAGAYLSGSTCLPCSTSCITCSGSANSCSQCPPGQYFQSTQCALCPNNCNACSSQNICTQCNKGFALTLSNVCRSCIATCSSCSPTNITQCTSCAYGLQLSGGSCIQCPLNCLSCNNGVCATCAPGFTPNSNGVCVLNCQLPCATCSDNQPTNCLSCYGNATLSNNVCSLDLSCNNASSCTDCGQGQNYILISGKCLPCTQITNCLQCSTSNSQICAICSVGYFVNGTVGCGVCPSQCISCTSANICTACAVGYTLPDGQTQGQCLQCQSPCATCIDSPTYCGSCVSGFTKKGWKCRNNTYVGFTIVLGDSPANILANIDTIVAAILQKLGLNTTNVQAITFSRIASGSTVLAGDFSSSSSSSVSTSASLLSAGLVGSSLGGFPVSSASVTSYVNGEPVSQSGESSNKRLGLIIGLSIGIPVFVIIAIVIIYCSLRKKGLQSRNTISDNRDLPLQNNSSVSVDEVKNSRSEAEVRNSGTEAANIDNWQKQIAA